MKEITIIITDDHHLVREAWSLILNNNSQFKVIAECGSGEEAIEKAKDLRPNVVIMDINLPGINGIEATEKIRKYSPASKILAISSHAHPSYARKMMQKGAFGYVTKTSSCEEMFKAIREVNAGKRYICNEIKNILSGQLLNDREPNGINCLSCREIEIIEFVKKGNTSKEIASLLNVSIKTIEAHRYNILKKLNLKNTMSLIHFIHNSQVSFIN